MRIALNHLRGWKLGQQFVIVRPLRAVVGSQADHDLLKPKTPFVRANERLGNPSRKSSLVFTTSSHAIPYTVKLSKADIPNNLAETLSSGSSSEVIDRVRRDLPTEAMGQCNIRPALQESDLDRRTPDGVSIFTNRMVLSVTS